MNRHHRAGQESGTESGAVHAGHDLSAHSHGAGANRPRLACALIITLLVFVAQVIGSVLTGSLALLFDSAHVLTDAAGLAMALFAAWLVAKPAGGRRTWGFARAEVLSATCQAALLLGVGLFVLVEGVQRLVSPEPIAGPEMVIFGAIGLAGNIVSLAVLSTGRKASFTTKAAFLEVLNDALGSIAVIVAALIIALTGWLRADAIVAMLIGVLILPRTIRLLMDTVNVLMEAAPKGVDLSTMRQHLLAVHHVVAVHDLHVSLIASNQPVLSAHVVVDAESFRDGLVPTILDQLQDCVSRHFTLKFEHSTFQLEPAGHTSHEPGMHE